MKSGTSSRSRTENLGHPVVLMILVARALNGCAAPGDARSAPAQAVVAEVPTRTVATQPEGVSKPFSGEIVFRLTAISPGASLEGGDLGELHYFISGAHWKHVDSNGVTTALYDPDKGLVYHFKPQPKTVDARVSNGPATFEALPETRMVLGRKCKGLRWTTPDRKITGFYDPNLFVDRSLYADHHYGHWAETLEFTGGALILWSQMDLPQGTIISEPIAIEPREFDAAFWRPPTSVEHSP